MEHNDREKAQSINLEFQKQYPDLGPITLKKSDIRMMKNRKQVSRLNRIMQGFPKEYRPQFQQMIDQAQLEYLARDLERHPVTETIEGYFQ